MDFKRDMSWDKIKISHGARVKMESFLSFLTIDFERPGGRWLGKDNGWTKVLGRNNLILTGGIVGGVEYLDSIQYGKNMHNPYNNYVNPFYLFEVMTKEGRDFFLDLYREDIKKALKTAQQKAEYAVAHRDNIERFWAAMGRVEAGGDQ